MLRRWRIGDPAPSHLNSYQSETQPYPGKRHNQGGKYCHHKIADSVFYIPHLFSLPSKRSRGLPIAIHRQWPKQYQRNAVFRYAPLSRGETGHISLAFYVNVFQSTPLSRGETAKFTNLSPHFSIYFTQIPQIPFSQPPKPQYLPHHFHNLHNPFPVRIPQRFYVHL